MNRTVTLVDTNGSPLGQCDILQAHTGEGKLHKAFSVFIFNPDRSKTLIQKRAAGKMLWPGIWANTCCSHPFENEGAIDAGKRRLQEEMGVLCELTEAGDFVYRALDPFGKGVEHEHDTILIGTMDETASTKPNPDEVAEWKWIKVTDLMQDFSDHPQLYTPWLVQGLSIIADNAYRRPGYSQ